MGRQTSITGYAISATGQTTAYTYDDVDRITKVAYPHGNDITYGYNAAAQVIRHRDRRGIATTFAVSL